MALAGAAALVGLVPSALPVLKVTTLAGSALFLVGVTDSGVEALDSGTVSASSPFPFRSTPFDSRYLGRGGVA